MEIEKSYLYTHLGHSVYSDIEKIDNAIDLIVESMIAYKDNELKKLRVTDVSRELLHPKCDEACYYHCTKGGQQPRDCIK